MVDDKLLTKIEEKDLGSLDSEYTSIGGFHWIEAQLLTVAYHSHYRLLQTSTKLHL